MAKTTVRTALLSSQSLAGGAASVRTALDCSALDGGQITLRITNGGTPPAVQCTAKVLVSHKTSAAAAAAESTGDDDYKEVYRIGGGLGASASTRGRFVFGPEVNNVEVEFGGNTSQSVTIEAIASTYVY